MFFKLAALHFIAIHIVEPTCCGPSGSNGIADMALNKLCSIATKVYTVQVVATCKAPSPSWGLQVHDDSPRVECMMLLACQWLEGGAVMAHVQLLKPIRACSTFSLIHIGSRRCVLLKSRVTGAHVFSQVVAWVGTRPFEAYLLLLYETEISFLWNIEFLLHDKKLSRFLPICLSDDFLFFLDLALKFTSSWELSWCPIVAYAFSKQSCCRLRPKRGLHPNRAG